MKRFLWISGVLVIAALAVWFGFLGYHRLRPTPQPVSTVLVSNTTTMLAQEEEAADLVLLLDQSGSMSRGRSATDPTRLRVAGSLACIDFLAGHISATQFIRFGLVNFGSTVSDNNLPLTDVAALQGAQAPQARQIIKPLDMGDTNMLAAMRKGVALLGTPSRPNTTRAMVLFTDGEPDDSRHLGARRYFPELQNYVRQVLDPRDILLFVIGIDANGARWSTSSGYWQQFVPADRLIHVRSMEEMKLAFATIIQRLQHVRAGAEESISTAPAPVSFTVPPYQERLDCFVFSTSTYTITFTRPDGTEVHPGADPGVSEIKHLLASDQLSVADPPAGVWSYQARSNTPVRVVRNCVPLRARLVSPIGQQPAGKPVRLAAQLTKEDGTPVPMDPQHPMEVTAEVKTPDDPTPHQIKFPAEQVKDGMMNSEELPASTAKQGEMEVKMQTKVDGQVTSEQPTKLPITSQPYMQVPPDGLPEVEPGKKMELTQQLMQDGQEVPPEQAQQMMQQYQPVAQVYDRDTKQVVSTTELSYDKGKLRGRLHIPKNKGHRYLLLTSLKRRQTPQGEAPQEDSSVLALNHKQRGTPGTPGHSLLPTVRFTPSWDLHAVFTVIGFSLAVIIIGVLVILNFQYIMEWLPINRKPQVYYWSEQHSDYGVLDFTGHTERELTSYGLRLTYDPDGFVHVHAKSTGDVEATYSLDGDDEDELFYDAQDTPVLELTFRDRLEIIVRMDEHYKIRLHLATRAARISRPEHYSKRLLAQKGARSY